MTFIQRNINIILVVLVLLTPIVVIYGGQKWEAIQTEQDGQ